MIFQQERPCFATSSGDWTLLSVRPPPLVAKVAFELEVGLYPNGGCVANGLHSSGWWY